MAFLNNAELVKLPSINGATSWSNKRVGQNKVLSKIDRVLGNKSWLELWPHVKVKYHPCGTSDHDYMTIELTKTAYEASFKRSGIYTSMDLQCLGSPRN